MNVHRDVEGVSTLGWWTVNWSSHTYAESLKRYSREMGLGFGWMVFMEVADDGACGDASTGFVFYTKPFERGSPPKKLEQFLSGIVPRRTHSSNRLT